MKKLTLLISVFLLQLGCSRNNEDEIKNVSYPECLSTQIQLILQNPIQNPKSTIKKYIYNGNIVYIVGFNFPDSQSPVYNDKCELICAEGGIGGNSTSTCVNWESATYLETVWTDPR
ncbi:DUF6970 domain-containing protein [Flavobacterium sp.]|jgi:hypothetical protein|uniref:DUF6970 domain-containing protein n=1 Tax=Flavobacterium sp. TaxID=239 RepID=UPI0037C08C1C